MKIRAMAAVVLIIFMLSLWGCGKDDIPTVTDTYETEMVFGVFESDKLQVLPWNSGRCEKTTANKVIETENGYYYLYRTLHMLHYADKTDLNYWVKSIYQSQRKWFIV